MKKFIISTIAAAALTAGMAGAASTASAAMPALGAKIQTSAPAAKDGAVQVGYFVRYRRCVNYYRWYYNPYYGRYFKRYVGRRCYFYRRYVY